MKNERFFGLHFDFHASENSPVGLRTNSEDIEHYIREIQPDYIQCDCKGHPGIACYPTKVGTASKNMKADNLRFWVNAAHNCQIPIYMHYSGVVDGEYCKNHPERSFNYARDDQDIRTNVLDDHYLHELLIPQLKELIDEYAADGIWVDGDCWPIGTEFTDVGHVTETMKPYLPENITKKELDKVLRDAYLKFLKTYVDEIHAYAPDFKIISNWAYTSYMPEEPIIDVDFLSGDCEGTHLSYKIRYEGRCMASQGKPWDIMPWSFDKWQGGDKSAVQLCQEAASAIILGGGFEVYTTQNPDGSIRQKDLSKLKELGEFLNRRKFNFRKKMKSQIGVFYSAETRYENGNCFNQSGSTVCLQGVLNAILDAQYTADIVMEYQLDTLSKYDLVAVPEWEKMSDAVKQKLLAYANKGGNLLIIGAELTQQMAENCDAIAESGMIQDSTGAFIRTERHAVLPGTKRPMYKNADLRDTDTCEAYQIISHGEGKIAYIPFDLGSMYAKSPSYILRNFVNEVAESLIEKAITINKKSVDITLIEDGDSMILNLLNQNQNGGFAEVFLYDDIPSIHEIEVFVRGNYQTAESLTEDEVTFQKTDDGILLRLSKLAIHSAIRLR